jgi:mono/diheme cytochrome c family protein
MKLISLVLTCAVIALIGTACTETVAPTNNTATTNRNAAPTPAASVDEFATARANFTKHCEACHGPNGEGGLVKVEDKQIKVASLKSDHAKKHTDDELTKIVTGGEEAMPPFKDKLSAAEITDLVRFVRHHFQGKS